MVNHFTSNPSLSAVLILLRLPPQVNSFQSRLKCRSIDWPQKFTKNLWLSEDLVNVKYISEVQLLMKELNMRVSRRETPTVRVW